MRANRETDVWEAAYRQHFPALMRVAYLMTGSNAVAEDVVHDVFVACADRLEGLDDPGPYLRVSVVNGCRRHHRRRARTAEQAQLCDEIELPSELVELRDGLDRLDHRKRAAVVFRYFLDMPYEEIAAALNCRPSTARSLVHRSLRQLKEVLQ